MAESHSRRKVLGKALRRAVDEAGYSSTCAYKWHAVTSLVLTILSAPLVLAGPPLTKAAIDLFLHPIRRNRLQGSRCLKHLADRFGFGAQRVSGNRFHRPCLLYRQCRSVRSSVHQAIVMQARGST